MFSTSPRNSETHFKVLVVSRKFETVKSPVQRHRLVNDAPSEQLEGPVHALSIITKTPAQWQDMLDKGETIQVKGDIVSVNDNSVPRTGGGQGRAEIIGAGLTDRERQAVDNRARLDFLQRFISRGRRGRRIEGTGRYGEASREEDAHGREETAFLFHRFVAP